MLLLYLQLLSLGYIFDETWYRLPSTPTKLLSAHHTNGVPSSGGDGDDGGDGGDDGGDGGDGGDGVDGGDGGDENAVDSDAAPDDGDGNDHLGQSPRLFLHCKGICTSLVTGY